MALGGRREAGPGEAPTFYAGGSFSAISNADASYAARHQGCPPCEADCDANPPGVLDIFDFLCFQNLFDAGSAYACDCDTGSGPGVCDVFDFLCFQNAFGAGCP